MLGNTVCDQMNTNRNFKIRDLQKEVEQDILLLRLSVYLLMFSLKCAWILVMCFHRARPLSSTAELKWDWPGPTGARWFCSQLSWERRLGLQKQEQEGPATTTKMSGHFPDWIRLWSPSPRPVSSQLVFLTFLVSVLLKQMQRYKTLPSPSPAGQEEYRCSSVYDVVTSQ